MEKGLFRPRIIKSRNNETTGGGNNKPPDRSTSDGQEDLKISKMLRKLNTENTLIGALDLCDKLKVAILDPTNGGYIKRSFDILADQVIGALEIVPIESLDAVVDIFGAMGFVMKNDFPAYKAWIVKVYKSSKHLRLNMMQALLVTLKMDKHNQLSHFAGRLIELLKDFLEQVDTASVFIGIMNVIGQFSLNYPKQFDQHFKDIVDICIGWHLETEQKPYVKHECSKVLQTLAPFWRKDIKFTTSLLGQFLEDIEACNLENMSSSEQLSLGSFIAAFNTVLKCLSTAPEHLMALLGKEFLEQSFEKVLTVSSIAIQQTVHEDVILPINEHFILFLSCYSYSLIFNLRMVEEIFQQEIKNLDHFTEHTILSLLSALTKYVEVVKNDLPLTFIDQMFDDSISKLPQLRFRTNKSIQLGFALLYHYVLDIKNVSILQRTYNLMLMDFQCCLNYLLHDEENCEYFFMS